MELGIVQYIFGTLITIHTITAPSVHVFNLNLMSMLVLLSLNKDDFLI